MRNKLRELYSGEETGISERDIIDVYSSMTNEDVMPFRDEWNSRMHQHLDDLGSRIIRQQDIPDPFKLQVQHMIKLLGLTPRKWNLVLSAVIVPEQEAAQVKYEKMCQACKYQGFDPMVILRSLYMSWVRGNRGQRTTFAVEITFRGENEVLHYSNKEPLMDDMYFLILIFLNRGAVVSKILKKSAKHFSALL